MYRFAASSLRAGDIPLWNPHQYAGAPFAIDNQAGIFYPINLLLFLINPEFSYRAIEGLVIWHFFFAGSAMYFCARLLQAEKPIWRPAALVAGLAFMFSGVFIAHIGNLNLIAVAAWLPLCFLALHRAITHAKGRGGLAWALAGGLFLGVGTLAGHGQMTFLLASFLAVYAVYCAIRERHAWPVLAVAILGASAIALAAVNLLPSFAALPYTVRAGFDPGRAANYALPWRGLLGLAAPNFFGRGEVQFWGDWPRVEYGYSGVLTLFLAGMALFKSRSKLVLFLALALLLFLLLAVGPAAPLYPLLLRLLPFFPFQVPARFVLLVDFCLALLAALGMAALRAEPPPLRNYLVTAAVAAASILGLLLWQARYYWTQVPHHQSQMAWAIVTFAILAAASWFLILARGRQWLSAPAFGALAVLLLGADLILLGRALEIEPNDPMPGFAAQSAALAYLHADPGLHRLDIATSAWQPNLPQLEGLYAIGGVYNPLELANYAAYIGSVGYRGSTLYNLLGTKYVISGKKSPPADTTFVVPVFEDDPEVTVYLNTRALPRAAVIYSATVVEDHDDAFEAVHQDYFDPLREVVLETGARLEQEAGQSVIQVLRYDTDYLAFAVTTDRPGFFLLSDIYHPGWQAAVDGQEAPVLVANYALRAVPLEAGAHRLEMWFRPAGWIAGVLISSLAWMALVAMLLVHFWKSRKAALAGNSIKAIPQ